MVVVKPKTGKKAGNGGDENAEDTLNTPGNYFNICLRPGPIVWRRVAMAD